MLIPVLLPGIKSFEYSVTTESIGSERVDVEMLKGSETEGNASHPLHEHSTIGA